MKHCLILFCVAVLRVHSFSQTGPPPIKEDYDKVYSNYVPSSINYTNHLLTGNSLSWTLSSLLRLYEATGDKSYLIKFINLSINIQNARQDRLNPNNSSYPPKWTLDTDQDCGSSECTYFNSLLIYPMAEFVYRIHNDQSLYNTNLPLNILDDQLIQPSVTVVTYGDFSLWLGARVEETILYMNQGYWDYNFGIQKSDSPIDVKPAEMNMQAPYGSAVLFMGLTNTDFGNGNNRATFLYQAQIIANNMKGNIDIDDACVNGSYHYPVLRDLTISNNSYWWYHAGWRIDKINCFPHLHQLDLLSYQQYIEDVAHGAMDLFFIRACYEAQLAPSNNSQPYFTLNEMERFRNTLTENIYYTDNSGVHFHNNVNGTNNPTQDPNCSPNCPPDLNNGEVLDWMPLYEFDGNSTPSAYDIILAQAINLISNPSTANLTGAESFLGLSEVVKAQWNMECVNLNLFNRDVVYDQNFDVKNNLIVEPQQNFTYSNINYYIAGTTDPFAEPQTFTDNGSKDRFIIESGITVNMTSGEEIVLGPGFVASSGCVFNASIIPSACTDGHRMTNSNNNPTTYNFPAISATTIQNSVAQQKNIPVFQNHLLVAPNPFKGTTNILFSIEEKSNVNLKITNEFGQEIFSEINNVETEKGNYTVPFDGSNLEKGIYFCILQINEQTVETKKMVVL